MIKEIKQQLKEENEKQCNSLKCTSQRVSKMKVSHNKLAEDLKNTNDLLKETRQELELQKICSIRLEAHSRRNIKFFNVQKTEKDGSYMYLETEKDVVKYTVTPSKSAKDEPEKS